jgi:hypothetical protein
MKELIHIVQNNPSLNSQNPYANHSGFQLCVNKLFFLNKNLLIVLISYYFSIKKSIVPLKGRAEILKLANRASVYYIFQKSKRDKGVGPIYVSNTLPSFFTTIP